LKEYEITHGAKPDFLIIDYLDLLFPNDKRIDPSNLFIKDKFVSEEIRALMHETNAFGATASQLTRCVSLDTMVIEEHRGPIQIRNVTPGDRIAGSAGFVEVKDVFQTGKKVGYRIKTKSGKTIICSENHRFPTPRGLMSISGGLSVGDKLTTENCHSTERNDYDWTTS
jgi:hypothetical protein